MTNENLKSNMLSTAAAIALALGVATPLWAQDPRRLAMMDMDEMGMMKKMDPMAKKGGMGDKPMTGTMPADASMPANDQANTMQQPMAAPPRADMMGRMRGSMNSRGMSNMAPSASLPGFPGASHLYHVGATGFFLDHPQHIALSIDQLTALNRIKEKALLDRSSFDRRIADAEQELWTLSRNSGR